MKRLFMPEIGQAQIEVALSALRPGELLCVRCNDGSVYSSRFKGMKQEKIDDIDYFLRVEDRPRCHVPFLSINNSGQWMHYAGLTQKIALKQTFDLFDFETSTNGTVHYGIINEIKVLSIDEAKQFLSNFINIEHIYANNIVWRDQNYTAAHILDFDSLKTGDILFAIYQGKEFALRIDEIVDNDFFRAYMFYKDENSIGRVTYLPRKNTYHQSTSSLNTYYIPCLAHHEHSYLVHLAWIHNQKVVYC